MTHLCIRGETRGVGAGDVCENRVLELPGERGRSPVLVCWPLSTAKDSHPCQDRLSTILPENGIILLFKRIEDMVDRRHWCGVGQSDVTTLGHLLNFRVE